MGEARRRALSRVREVLPPVLARRSVGMPAPHDRWTKDGLSRHLRAALAAAAARQRWMEDNRFKLSTSRWKERDELRKLVPLLERAPVYVAQLNPRDAAQLLEELAVWEVLES